MILLISKHYDQVSWNLSEEKKAVNETDNAQVVETNDCIIRKLYKCNWWESGQCSMLKNNPRIEQI